MPGVISAGNPLTAEAGARIFRQGGNAVDAAVAACFASFVAESTLVNIGAAGIAQIFNPRTGESIVYDFVGDMPGKSINFKNRLKEIDFRRTLVHFGEVSQEFYIGRASAGVPAAVGGLARMHKDFGNLSFAEVLAPAIELAHKGFHMTAQQEHNLHIVEEIFGDTQELLSMYTVNGGFAKKGDFLSFPQLADTLTKIAESGPEEFYEGEIAKNIVHDQRENGGLITMADLKESKTHKLPPIKIDYRGYSVHLPLAPSSGGVLIAFSLKLMESLPLSTYEPNGLRHLQVLCEVMRLTNLARALLNMEEDDTLNSVDDLLSDENVAHFQEMLALSLENPNKYPVPPSPEGKPSTTHVSVADEEGFVIGITTTSGESGGYVIPGTGIILNNMLGESDLNPNGFHTVLPGTRLVTMMTPTIVMRDNQPVLTVGTGGANRIRTAILQVISNQLDFEMPLSQAVESPRVHFEDGVAQIEGGINQKTVENLENSGYECTTWPTLNMFFGGTHSVGRVDIKDPSSPWVAVGDPRRAGAVQTVE